MRSRCLHLIVVIHLFIVKRSLLLDLLVIGLIQMLVESCCNSRLLLLLLLQLNGEIRGEQHLLLLLKQMKVSLHHHFVNGRIPPSATPVLA
jgi:hypothetical protein